MAAGLRHLLAISMIVMVHGVAGIGQGLAEPDPASVVRIEMSEYAFTPAQVTLKAGKPVTLNVINVGRATQTRGPGDADERATRRDHDGQRLRLR